MARTEASKITQSLEDGTFFVDKETPVGAINGVNTSFTLANTPNPSISLRVKVNGVDMLLTTDYSIIGDTLTMVVAPRSGESIRVWYRVEPV